MLKQAAFKGIALLTATAGPMQRLVDQSCGLTHQYCNDQALSILKANGLTQEVVLLEEFYEQLQQGVVWADQHWQNVHHFFNPDTRRGLWQFFNAAVAYSEHYAAAIKFMRQGRLRDAVFYLGAAAHIVQDTCVPHHAKCKLFSGHKQYEHWVETHLSEFIFKGTFHMSAANSYETMRNNAGIALDFYSYVIEGAGDYHFFKATETLLPLAQESTVNLFYSFCTAIKQTEDVPSLIPSFITVPA